MRAASAIKNARLAVHDCQMRLFSYDKDDFGTLANKAQIHLPFTKIGSIISHY